MDIHFYIHRGEESQAKQTSNTMDESELTPKQARSRESQRRILDATLALLNDRHFEALTVADIAENAGMAVGNFYKRYKNKEALLPHLYAEYNRRFADFASKMKTDDDTGDSGWPRIVKGSVDFFADNAGLIRALHLNSRINPALVPEGSTETRHTLYEGLEVLLAKPGRNANVRNRRARMAALVMVSTITEAMLYPNLTPAVACDLDRDTMVKELTEILQRYSA